MSLSSYQHPLALGHRYLADLFLEPVVIQEKIDGSQMSAGVLDGQLHLRSRGAVLHVGQEPNGLFGKACHTFRDLHDRGLLPEGWVFRGEAISKRKHNCLSYDRIPRGGVILFDIEPDVTTWYEWRSDPELLVTAMQNVAAGLGLEFAPAFFTGLGPTMDALKAMLERESCLGGVKVEGVVIKNYWRLLNDRPMMAKLVRPEFKETQRKDWKTQNPNKRDVIEQLGEELRTEARWRKAIQHLREQGRLTCTPSDIGPLMREIMDDVWIEEADHIKEVLGAHFRRQIVGLVSRGFPEFYKEKLAHGEIESN